MTIDVKGYKVKIDRADWDRICAYKWHIGSTGYAVWRGVKDGRKQTIRMHRLITGCPAGRIVDHINHDRLDNRRSNLRVCTQSENMRNLRDQGKGYWYQQQNKNWVVEVHGKHRGTFSTEQEAKEFAERVRLGVADRKPKIPTTHCKYGHALTDAYDYGLGKRCRTCQSNRSREYYQRRIDLSQGQN